MSLEDFATESFLRRRQILRASVVLQFHCEHPILLIRSRFHVET